MVLLHEVAEEYYKNKQNTKLFINAEKLNR